MIGTPPVEIYPCLGTTTRPLEFHPLVPSRLRRLSLRCGKRHFVGVVWACRCHQADRTNFFGEDWLQIDSLATYQLQQDRNMEHRRHYLSSDEEGKQHRLSWFKRGDFPLCKDEQRVEASGFYDMLSKLWRSTPEATLVSTRAKHRNYLKSGALSLVIIHTRFSVVAFLESLFGEFCKFWEAYR